jgi:endonuclease-3
MKVRKDLRNIAKEIIIRLGREYPEAKCHLEYKKPFELLVSTVLSAQCTDVRVNMVMVPLYEKKYKSPADVLKDGIDNFRENIKSITSFNNKSKAIVSMCESIVEEHSGKVPDAMEQLTELKGVGRKSANVVLGNCFGKKDAISVDTHVKRVSTRLGLVQNDNPDKIELELKDIIPDEEQFNYSLRVGEHGRQVCYAKKPECEVCLLNDVCPSVQE